VIQKGVVSTITDQEIRLQGGDKELKLPAAEVLDIQLQVEKAPPAGPYLEIGLNDGSRFLCQAFGLKEKMAELRLFTGHAINVRIDSIRYVLCEAHLEARRQEVEPFLTKRNGLDVLRLQSRDGMSVNTFEGFLGDADAQGETIRFTPEGGQPAQVSLSRV